MLPYALLLAGGLSATPCEVMKSLRLPDTTIAASRTAICSRRFSQREHEG